ncbi:histone H4, major-like [Diachasmimorpha longicaudata]|uniref:histone H4, major-like n=1 Tax=Diachasmimorpha longicaudata TaxID=58733 RepID=UPI0030B90867
MAVYYPGSGRMGVKRVNKAPRGRLTKPTIRRLARRGGVKRISGGIYDLVRQILRTFLETVIADAVIYTEHAKRKTVTAPDVVYALKRRGRAIYGFDGE